MKKKSGSQPGPPGKVSLDKFEQSIEDAEKFIPVTELEKAEIEAIIESAIKTKNINIRISAYDVEKVKQKSAEEGLPYQTLISSIIHKYITGKLVDEQAVLKSIQLLHHST
jgi:predicted DNA binding CopG/RHH family protein